MNEIDKAKDDLERMLEENFYLLGPRSRTNEFLFTLNVAREFIAAFRVLHFQNPCIAFFGSARICEGAPYYNLTREVAAKISQMGFTIMTGGGPGLMEAASRGAKEAGGNTVGINIRLPHEQYPNKYLDQTVTCDYFFVRKVLMFKYSYGFIIMPGGMGTFDEFFEILTLVQTHKTQQYPIIMMGIEFWKPFRELMNNMVLTGMINEVDQELVYYTDSADDAVEFLAKNAVKKFRLKQQRKFKKTFLFGE